MKNNIYIFTIIILTGLFSCKKEVFEQAREFGTIRFNNQSGLVSLKLVYNNEPYTGLTLNNVKLPAGKATFSFIDPATNKVLLDTALTVAANTTEELILFKPDEAASLVLLKNTQADEPKPGAGLMKVKIANLASKALPGNIDLIFYGLDDELFDYVPLDTLENISKQFPESYVQLKNATSINDPSLLVKIMDAGTKEVLTDIFIQVPENYNWETAEFYSVFTLYLKDDENGLPVNGTNYKVNVGTLFFN